MKAAILLSLFASAVFADAKIFCYHRFDDPKHKNNSMNIETQEFRAQLEMLKKEGYKVVKLSEILSFVQSGKKMPEKLAAITVDDAYKSFAKNGLSVLKEYGYPFTLFVYVKAVDMKWPDFTPWDEVREIKKYGDVELHSFAHENLSKMSRAQMVEDTQKAVDIFKKQMGYSPRYYAYPFGAYDDKVIAALKPFGFEASFAVNGAPVDEYSDKYAIDRIAVSHKANFAEELRMKLLDIVWQKPKEANASAVIVSGTIKDYNGSHIRVRVQKQGWQTLAVKDGHFELSLCPMDDKTLPKLRFQAADNRFVIKTIAKE